MKKQIRFFSSCVLALMLSLALFAQSTNLVVVETSDIHGMLFPYNFFTKSNVDNSLAQISTVLNDLRADKKNTVIYLDNGDYYQGQPVIYWANFMKASGTHLGAQVLNFLKADAVSAGNHDIETGHPVYDKLVKQTKAPVLAANIVNTQNGQPYFKPYTVINRNGLKIAVIGMITPGVPTWLPEVLWSGMKFEDITESAKKWVKIVQDKEKPDFIIGLFHTGLGNGTEAVLGENVGLKTAQQVDGFDLIALGHSHAKINQIAKSPNGSTVFLMEPTDAARAVAIAQVPFTKQNGKWVKGETQVEIRDVIGKNIPADPAYIKAFEKDFTEAKTVMSEPIGTIAETISTRDSLFGPSKFVDLIHQLQFDLAKNVLKKPADISFSAPLLQNGTLKEGQILVGDLFTLYVYENWFYVMTMSGQEIKDYLEYNYDIWNATMSGPNSYMIRYTLDENGKLKFNERYNSWQTFSASYNYDTAAGIEYTVDLSKPAGQRVNIIKFADGKPFDLKQRYNVAINSYRGNGGGGHLTAGAKIPKEELTSRIVAATEKDLRVYLGDAIKKAGTVTPPLYNNWKYLPEDWIKTAREREYKMWYPEN